MNWINKTEDCMLCDMKKKTKWYKETERFVVAEKLGGGPFVVIKEHLQEPDDQDIERAHEIVNEIFGDHEFKILMNIVSDHWHAHLIVDDDNIDLSDE